MLTVRVFASLLPLLALLPAAGDDKTKSQGAGKTFAEISTTFDEQAAKVDREMKEKRLAAVDGYLSANPKATDRADALEAAAGLASEVGKHDRAATYAEKFANDFSQDGRAMEMRLLQARSLGQIAGKSEAARQVYAKVLADASANVNISIGAATGLAELLVDANDIAGAKETLDSVATKFKSERGLGEYLASIAADYDAIGKDLPHPIDVKGIDGRAVSTAALKGKVVLVDFWATWCGPCIQELPNVLATYKKFHDKGFEILGISLDSDEAKLKSFIAQRGMPWPNFFDGKGWKNAVAVEHGIQSIPATYLLDANGKVYRKGLRGPALERAVEKLIASATPTTEKAKPAPAGGPKKG